MRLVATYNIDRVWYAEHTVPFMRRYAHRVGADFVEYRQFPERERYGGCPAWSKVEAIKCFSRQTYYDQLLIIDADVLILPRCTDVFPVCGKKIGVVRDMGRPTVDGELIRWCDRHFNESPAPGQYFNAGMLVVPIEAAVRLEGHLAGPYPDEWAYDQDFLNLRLTRREQLCWLPEEFNWLAPQFKESGLQQQMVHFVGDWKALLPWYTERLGRQATEPDQA